MDADVPSMIHQARRQDPATLDQLLDIYRNYLRVLAQVWLADEMLGKLDPSDLVQETLLKAYQRFHQFQGGTEAELAIWLRRILSRLVVDVVRRYQGASRDVRRERSLDRDFDGSADAFRLLMAASGSSPSHKTHRRELGVLLAEALVELSAGQRQVIILRSLKEKEWKQVAQAMDRTVSSVRAMWLRGLTELRTSLQKNIE
jgi:RNA polymerase sigma-70 factor (ECF subfamily)